MIRDLSLLVVLREAEVDSTTRGFEPQGDDRHQGARTCLCSSRNLNKIAGGGQSRTGGYGIGNVTHVGVKFGVGTKELASVVRVAPKS